MNEAVIRVEPIDPVHKAAGWDVVEDSVVKDLFTTAADGKRYHPGYYNLDVILSVS